MSARPLPTPDAALLQSVAPCQLLLLGPWGSGYTTVLNALAEAGFLHVAGLTPESLIPTLHQMASLHARVVYTLAIDADDTPDELLTQLSGMQAHLPALQCLILDAPTDVLIARYQGCTAEHPWQSRRPHEGLDSLIAEEKSWVGAFRALKQAWPTGFFAIDTSLYQPAELRHKVLGLVGVTLPRPPMVVNVVSFGFKYGLPADADLVLDARFIENPYYTAKLRPLTGLDQPVADAVMGAPGVTDFLSHWQPMVLGLLPHYQAQGKFRLTIAVGCTGGQHRSVCLAQALAQFLTPQASHEDFQVLLTHRESSRWGGSRER